MTGSDKLAKKGGIGNIIGAREVLAQTGLLAQIGEQNVLPSDAHIGGSLDAGWRRGHDLLAELRGTTP